MSMLRISFTSYEDADFVTHSGKFHADEVMATAILFAISDKLKSGELKESDLPEVLRGKLGGTQFKLCRISAIPDDASREGKMIYDVGGGEFDHHQVNRNGKRENGIFYASVGLIWKAFGKLLCDGVEEFWQDVDERLIQTIDSGDNGQFAVVSNGIPILNLDELIGAYNPCWNEDQSLQLQNLRFSAAVDFAKGIFDRLMRREKAIFDAFPAVRRALADCNDGVMVLPEYVSWEDGLAIMSRSNPKAKEVLLAIFPSNRDPGAYIIQSPRDGVNSRMYMPEAWRGKRGQELGAIVEGGTFCHPTGFMAVADSLPHAISLATEAVRQFRSSNS